MKNIICFKLRHSDLKVLTESVKKYKDFKIVEENNLDVFLKLDVKKFTSCFIYVDESLDLKTFDVLIKKMNEIPLNIIFKYKDFDMLMACYKNQLCSVFESKLIPSELENTLVRIDLLSEKKDELPVSEIVKLFSSPVKIKSNLELYQRVSKYLGAFDSVRAFSVIVLDENGSEDMGDIFSTKLEKKLMSFTLPEKYIGHEVEIDSKGRSVVATPVLSTETQTVWLLIQVDPLEKSFILNDLFYKYLENVLIYRVNKEKEESLTILATTDDVTGLFNQRKLAVDLAKAVEFHEKQHEKFSIMFLDVDHFKSVNDNYGHVIGSKLLQDIGEVLALILRESDHIYRYGGDEFVVIMPTVDIKTVHEIATRVLSKIKNKNFEIDNGEIYKLSVSIGVAEYPTDAKSAIEIIKFADEMMYMSKRSGRGKVFHIKEVDNADANRK